MALMKFLSLRINYTIVPKHLYFQKQKWRLPTNVLQSASEKVSQEKYNTYTPQQTAKIRKNAAENSPTRAAKHFTAIWNIHVNESTARRLKSEYLVPCTKKIEVAINLITLHTRLNLVYLHFASNKTPP